MCVPAVPIAHARHGNAVRMSRIEVVCEHARSARKRMACRATQPHNGWAGCCDGVCNTSLLLHASARAHRVQTHSLTLSHTQRLRTQTGHTLSADGATACTPLLAAHTCASPPSAPPQASSPMDAGTLAPHWAALQHNRAGNPLAVVAGERLVSSFVAGVLLVRTQVSSKIL